MYCPVYHVQHYRLHFTLNFSSFMAELEPANITTQPVSTQVALNERAKFQCVVTCVSTLQWLLNNVTVIESDQGRLDGVAVERSNSNNLDSSLYINASTTDSDGKVIYNNSNVSCKAIRADESTAAESEKAILQIQGNFTLASFRHQCNLPFHSHDRI